MEASARALIADGYEIEWCTTSDTTGRGFFGAIHQAGDIATQSYWLTTQVMAHSGATVIPNCAVRKIEQEGGIVTVHGQRATVRAPQVCLCTNAYSRTLHPYFKDKVFPTRGQMLATAPTTRFMEMTMGCEWGDEYFRQLPDGRFMIGGWRNRHVEEEVGYNDHGRRRTSRPGLESFLHKYSPELDGLPIEHRWSGIMGFTADDMPLSGGCRIYEGLLRGRLHGRWHGHRPRYRRTHRRVHAHRHPSRRLQRRPPDRRRPLIRARLLQFATLSSQCRGAQPCARRIDRQ